MGFTEDDCIEALQQAANELGKSPEVSEYDELDISPKSRTIRKICESWNSAKERAGLELCKPTSTAKRLYVNESYFNKIDSGEKAYWLGFIYADGSVFNGNVLSLTLQNGDRDHIELFADTLESEHTISTFENEWGEYCRTSIVSDELTDDLKSYGVVPGKTYTDSLPSLDDEYISSFIRGYFDGDGNFTDRNGIGRWRITSVSNPRLQQLSDWLDQHGIDSSVRQTSRGESNLVVTHRDKITELSKYMYPNDLSTEPAMGRKMTKILEYVKRGD